MSAYAKHNVMYVACTSCYLGWLGAEGYVHVNVVNVFTWVNKKLKYAQM